MIRKGLKMFLGKTFEVFGRIQKHVLRGFLFFYFFLHILQESQTRRSLAGK